MRPAGEVCARVRAIMVAVAAAVMLVAPTTAQAAGAPSIAWSPSTFDYGAVTPGQTPTRIFTLRNSGGSATAALSVALSGSTAFSITQNACTGTALGKGKSCTVTVQYSPSTAGQTDTVTLTASAKKPPATASVTLSGLAAGPLRLSPPRASSARH